MTKLTSKQLKIIADYEALCREIQCKAIKTVSVAVYKNFSSCFVHDHYNSCYSGGLTGASLADCIQSALDKFNLNNPSQCELARRKVKQLEDDLAAAKASMELVCNV